MTKNLLTPLSFVDIRGKKIPNHILLDGKLSPKAIKYNKNLDVSDDEIFDIKNFRKLIHLVEDTDQKISNLKKHLNLSEDSILKSTSPHPSSRSTSKMKSNSKNKLKLPRVDLKQGPKDVFSNKGYRFQIPILTNINKINHRLNKLPPIKYQFNLEDGDKQLREDSMLSFNFRDSILKKTESNSPQLNESVSVKNKKVQISLFNETNSRDFLEDLLQVEDSVDDFQKKRKRLEELENRIRKSENRVKIDHEPPSHENHQDSEELDLFLIKFGSHLSEDGNYAMLKCYEDMIYKELMSMYPNTSNKSESKMHRTNTETFMLMPRKFNGKKSSKLVSINENFNAASIESLLQTAHSTANMTSLHEAAKHKYKVSKHIEKAMKLFDLIQQVKKSNRNSDAQNDVNNNEDETLEKQVMLNNKLIKAYESWYNSWKNLNF